MPAGPRYSPSLLVAHGELFRELVTRLRDAGGSDEKLQDAWWFFRTHLNDWMNLGGAMGVGLPEEEPAKPPINPPPLPVTPRTTPWPAGTFTEPVVVDPVPLTREEPQERVIHVTTDRIFALPLRLPSSFNGILKGLDMGTAEYIDPITLHHAWFSRSPGEFAPIGSVSQGTATMPMIEDCAAAGLQPGETIYLNIAMYSTDLARKTGVMPVQRLRTGGHWPR